MSSEILEFTDQNPSYGYTVDSQPDATYGQADMGDVSLANFLSRPVLIQSFDWSTDAPQIYERFNPWANFFEEPRIANRIAHYSLLRAKLKIRVLVNGNQFHFGRAIMSYVPLPDADYLTTDRAWVQQDLIQASQRPHIYIDPTYSQGGELSLPFFWYKNALSIPDSEWNKMGEMILHTINVLKHANGASDNVTINVFAWAEDVNLSAPTSETASTLDPQSGGSDEYGQGIISKPAGIVARAAGKLKNVPVIAPYARATEIGAGAISDIAGIFGFCRPNDVEQIRAYKPTFVGNMANTDAPDTAIKLTVDSKQELTIDPRTAGLSDVDEMNIKSIAQKESFLTKFDWPVSANRGYGLWNCAVTPTLWDLNGGEIHMPACCFATIPFQYWRGTINYRFQIVSSNFHRGRLRLIYDPYGQGVAPEYTTQYNRIIDIAEEKDFTVSIGWGAQTPYCTVYRPGVNGVQFGPGYNNQLPPSDTEGPRNNGIIGLEVVNDLTVPNSTVDNDIEVNVFVSVGDDFEVAVPFTTSMSRYTYYDPTAEALAGEKLLDTQSAESPVMDLEATEQPSAPVQSPTHEAAAMIDDTDATNHVFFGETISSFRPLLKRYVFHHADSATDLEQGVKWWKVRFPAFPYYRGKDPVAPVHDEYNYSANTLLNYLSPAFTGWRGNLKWKHHFTTNQLNVAGSAEGYYGDTPIVATRSNYFGTGNPAANDVVDIDLDQSVDNVAALFANNMPQTFLGSSVQSMAQNPVLETELPFYAPWRFFPTKVSPNANAGTFFSIRQAIVTLESLVRLGTTAPVVYNYVATGEDFNLFFFTGAPVMYYQSNLPAPTPLDSPPEGRR